MLAVGVAALVVATAACGDDSGGSDEESGGPSTSAGPTTTTTQPPATDTEEALAAVQEQADEASFLLEQLYTDPTVVDDAENEYIQRYGDVFTEDSETPERVFDHLR